MSQINFTRTKDTYCVAIPPKMGSNGLWPIGKYVREGVMEYALPQFFIQFILIFLLNKFLHYVVLRRIGFTQFASQLVAGVLLGPTCLGQIKKGAISELLFPKFYDMESHSEEYLDAVTAFACAFFVFIVAVKMDMGLLFRVGNKCWAIGLCAILVPQLIGIAALGNTVTEYKDGRLQLILIGIMQSITAFPVVSWLLQDLKLLNTELGRLALSSAAISDILSIVLAMLLTRLTNHDTHKVVRNSLQMAAFIVVVVFVIRPAMLWVARKTPEGQPVRAVYINIILILVFLSGVAAVASGQLLYFGPIILGFAVPEGPPLGSAIVGKLETFYQGILLPIYVTSTVAKVDLRPEVFHGGVDISPALTIISVVFALKIVACLAPPLICKVPYKDSLALAIILNCKGVVELGAYMKYYDQKIMNDENLALSVIAIILSATLMPLLLRKLYSSTRKYGGYQRRNLLNLKSDADLPLLACIHRPGNITATINLLDMLHPKKDSPLKIHVLHLTKLIGQSTPEIVHHHKRDSSGDGKSKSDAVIAGFTNYAVGKPDGAVTLNLFTLMSPPKMFSDYVNHLALDKLAALVVLPFHKRWSKDGVIDHEDANVENLNKVVLEAAPCSVAVVVDRGNLSQLWRRREEAPLRVGVFFLGGSDDREGVVLAGRMARDPAVHVTVVHLCDVEEAAAAAREGGVASWEKMMDEEVLRNVVVHGNYYKNVRYIKEFMEDGPQTALLVRSMVDQLDVVVVGRNYGRESTITSGLSEWAEVPELGVLGDMLASSDLTTRTSTIVVQQQKLSHK